MGFLSDLLSRSAPTQNSLQQEGNQMMLKMLQDRLAVSTCPTERQQLQNNISAIQKAMQQNQVPPTPTPMSYQQPQAQPQVAPNQKPNFQSLEVELSNLKTLVTKIENIIMALKAQ